MWGKGGPFFAFCFLFFVLSFEFGIFVCLCILF